VQIIAASSDIILPRP